MSDLIAFLTARLAEDEEVARDARACAEVKDGRWFDGEDEINDDNGLRLATVNHPFVTAHIARHDPSRVLREVEADRRLIEAYHDRANWAEELRDPDTDYRNVTEADARWEEGATAALLAAIQFRAAVYSDRPDYRQEWAI